MATNISDFERGVLKHLFRRQAVEVVWRINSRSASILGIRAARGPWVIKMPGWRVLEVLPPDQRAAGAVMMNEVTLALQARLGELGVRLPDYYRTMEISGFPVHQSSDHGEDCAQIVRRSPEELPGILRQIIQGLNGVFERGEEKVGIEARLSNFALSAEGKVIYIDIFPPLIHHNGQYFVHFPNPSDPEEVETEIGRKFRPFGILRRMRCDLLATNPIWDEPFFQALDEVNNPVLREDLKVRFRNLPDQRVEHLSTVELEELLEGLPFGDVDTRREIAAKVIPMSDTRDQVMAQVFASTSFVGVSDNERQARLERFLQIIKPFM